MLNKKIIKLLTLGFVFLSVINPIEVKSVEDNVRTVSRNSQLNEKDENKKSSDYKKRNAYVKSATSTEVKSLEDALNGLVDGGSFRVDSEVTLSGGTYTTQNLSQIVVGENGKILISGNVVINGGGSLGSDGVYTDGKLIIKGEASSSNARSANIIELSPFSSLTVNGVKFEIPTLSNSKDNSSIIYSDGSVAKIELSNNKFIGTATIQNNSETEYASSVFNISDDITLFNFRNNIVENMNTPSILDPKGGTLNHKYVIEGNYFNNSKYGISTLSDANSIYTLDILNNKFTNISKEADSFGVCISSDNSVVNVSGNEFISGIDGISQFWIKDIRSDSVGSGSSINVSENEVSKGQLIGRGVKYLSTELPENSREFVVSLYGEDIYNELSSKASAFIPSIPTISGSTPKDIYLGIPYYDINSNRSIALNDNLINNENGYLFGNQKVGYSFSVDESKVTANSLEVKLDTLIYNGIPKKDLDVDAVVYALNKDGNLDMDTSTGKPKEVKRVKFTTVENNGVQLIEGLDPGSKYGISLEFKIGDNIFVKDALDIVKVTTVGEPKINLGTTAVGLDSATISLDIKHAESLKSAVTVEIKPVGSGDENKKVITFEKSELLSGRAEKNVTGLIPNTSYNISVSGDNSIYVITTDDDNFKTLEKIGDMVINVTANPSEKSVVFSGSVKDIEKEKFPLTIAVSKGSDIVETKVSIDKVNESGEFSIKVSNLESDTKYDYNLYGEGKAKYAVGTFTTKKGQEEIVKPPISGGTGSVSNSFKITTDDLSRALVTDTMIKVSLSQEILNAFKGLEDLRVNVSGITARIVDDSIVLEGFVPGKKYSNIVVSYGSINGKRLEIRIANFMTRKETNKLNQFVLDVYLNSVKRVADEEGFAYWTRVIKDKLSTPKKFVQNLLNEDEFINLRPEIDQKIEGLYAVIVNRASDKEGFEFWKSKFVSLVQSGLDDKSALMSLVDAMVMEPEFQNRVNSLF